MKCHQYWPNPDSTTTYGNFTVTCHNEEGNSAFLVREMTLTHTPVTTHTHRFIYKHIMSKEGGKKDKGESKAMTMREEQQNRSRGKAREMRE